MTPARIIWFCVGVLAVGLGAVGVVLPLLPTTPFLLVAAYAFARSSERWHNWLVNHRVFGPIINDWQAHGAISRTTKIISAVSMVAIIGISFALGARPLVIIIQAIVLTCSAIFVLSRPLPPQP